MRANNQAREAREAREALASLRAAAEKLAESIRHTADSRAAMHKKGKECWIDKLVTPNGRSR
jgi:hypothetical protein